jgi:hypothetical protein
MNFDERYFGPEGVTLEEERYAGSLYSEVRRAIFANPYYLTWGAHGDPPLPVYETSLRRALSGVLPFGTQWRFGAAARRSLASRADLRQGVDGRGFRRIVHPNGVCLTGFWEIDTDGPSAQYSGSFQPGSRALIIARYSVCCTETRRGRPRSLSMVGKLFPTVDPHHANTVMTANFITQEDLGGSRSVDIGDVELRNAPDVTPWRRGGGLPVFLVTVLALSKADAEPSVRQLYEIAELGKPADAPTRAPRYMRLVTEAVSSTEDADLDFRDEVLARIYDRGNPKPQRELVFHIDVSDEADVRGRLVKRVRVGQWHRIGRIVFKEAVASYNGDFVLHFHHPAWRHDHNNPATLARKRSRELPESVR